MSEIKVGDWTLTPTEVNNLENLRAAGRIVYSRLTDLASQACEVLGIDPTTDSTARDICEEIVLHGTPVEEVIAKLQRHLEGGQ